MEKKPDIHTSVFIFIGYKCVEPGHSIQKCHTTFYKLQAVQCNCGSYNSEQT